MVRERGRLMNEASQRAPGAMAAILGLEADVVREICAQASQQTGKTLVLANDNCPGQLVISGDKEALDAALPLATERGAKRAMPLTVSVASHSPLMEAITPDFRAALNNTPFNAPAVPVIGNVQAAPLLTADAIRAELGDQLTSTVRWTESVQVYARARDRTVYRVGAERRAQRVDQTDRPRRRTGYSEQCRECQHLSGRSYLTLIVQLAQA